MIDDAWLLVARLRILLLVLAVIGLLYLFIQTQPAQIRISTWSGAQTHEAAVTGPKTISGQAVLQAGRGLEVAAADVPAGNPLGLPNTVLTQGYGVGTHAPPAVWGAVDLAIDSNGDGQADPEGTMNAPVYATHRGVVRLARNTYPAGNHIWLEGEQYKTGYSHLSDFAVADGQTVERGQVIGYVGSTGMSSGPHLDYQVWKDGVNVNPLGYGALDGTR